MKNGGVWMRLADSLLGTRQIYLCGAVRTGKQYNCDLSASYNIGARYFIRELLKSLPATEESRVKAKVPDAGRRISCTLSTLRTLVKELSAA